MASPLNLTELNLAGSNKNYKVINNKAVISLFSGFGQFSPFPTGIKADSGNVSSISTPKDIHSDDIYDTSISSLVEYTSKPGYESMKLDYTDFAYLKNVGVFPNNRLIIARRFPNGVANDLTEVKASPMATLISWVPDNEEFLSVAYNEEWAEAEASFEDVLNDIGNDILLGDNKGGKAGGLNTALANAIPLPGMMEGVQYEVMKKLGITDAGIGNSPQGNPNIIREAKMRKTVGKGQPGSGLTAKFTVAMVVEYEQKFINGIDPTLVYLDIIQKALTFGTSDASFTFNSAFAQGTSGIIRDLISGDLGAIGRALYSFVEALVNTIKDIGTKFIEALIGAADAAKKAAIDLANGESVVDVGAALVNEGLDVFGAIGAATIGHVISKYKIKLLGIVNALTGGASTPWHVTIGNPKKPLFTSGDMLVSEVKLTLGKTLAFNDLPSSIKIEFSLSNARSLGAQEIFNRFNSGRGRSYVRLQKSYVETSDSTIQDGGSQSSVQSGSASGGMFGEGKDNINTSEATINKNKQFDEYVVDSKSGGTDWLSSGPKVNNEVVQNPNNTAPIVADPIIIPPPTPPDAEPELVFSEYTYTVEVLGPKLTVVVFKKSSEIYRSQPSFSVPESILVDEAKNALRSQHPSIDSMTKK